MSEKKFYVYVHRYASGPKQGEVFYVGKGHSDRAYVKRHRNTHWKNIVNKYGYTIEIVRRFSFDICSRVFEKFLISQFGFENLCNMTNGGEGWHGKIVKEETRISISEKLKGHKHGMTGKSHTKETIIKMRKTALSQKRKGKPNKDKVVRVFKHKSGDLFFGFTSELACVIEGNGSHLYSIVAGKRKSCHGWSYVSTKEEYENEQTKPTATSP